MERIASLFPSATETLCALGLGDRLVAVSHACELPAGLDGPPRVTHSWLPAAATSGEIDRVVREHQRADRPLYGLDRERLAEAAPDLIITQRLCTRPRATFPGLRRCSTWSRAGWGTCWTRFARWRTRPASGPPASVS
jgi:ABC-type Fe3+-hydroxamate transport system substrate-binding protein